MGRGLSAPWGLFVVWGGGCSLLLFLPPNLLWSLGHQDKPCSPCPGRLLTLLLELLGEGRAEGVAIAQGDEAVEALALHRMRVADHGRLGNGLMLH